MKRRAWLVSIAMSSVVCGVALLGLRDQPSDEASSVISASPPTDSARATMASSAKHLGDRAGASSSYTIRMTNITRLGGERANAQEIELGLAGEMTIARAERDDELTHYRMNLRVDGDVLARMGNQ